LTKAEGSFEISALNRVEQDTSSLEQARTKANRFLTVVEWKNFEEDVKPK